MNLDSYTQSRKNNQGIEVQSSEAWSLLVWVLKQAALVDKTARWLAKMLTVYS